MKFNIAEFEFEEFESVAKKVRERQNSVIEEFKDETVKQKLSDIFSDGDKRYLRYVISEAFSERRTYAGEITFSGNKEGEYDVGIEIEEKLRRFGYGYRLLCMLIDRVCKMKLVRKLTYRVMSDNAASKALAEKLGGVLIKEIKPTKPIGFNFLIYEIKPFLVDYTFLTKYISLLANDEYNGWHSEGSGYTKLTSKFVTDIDLFVTVNEQLELRDYIKILRDNGIKVIYEKIDEMSELCLYASLVYFVRQDRFCDGLFLSSLKKGYIAKILKRIEQTHNN